MPRRQPFKLIYAPRVKDHLKVIEPKYYSLIRGTIEKQLRLEPDVETRNRKPLKRSIEFEAPWEIRFNILAIGEKKGSQLFISGEEFEL
jgi:hypothetical protein